MHTPQHHKKRKLNPGFVVMVIVIVAALALAAVALGHALKKSEPAPASSSEAVSSRPAVSSSTASSSSKPASLAPVSSSAAPVSSSAPPAGPANPLTGVATETDLSANRPIAVMINNIKVATPQYGIRSADMIFEVLAEGGITRLEGIFQDMGAAATIGSVRSARPYYIDIAQGFDAIYIHAGGSDDAYVEIKNRGLDDIDGVNGRDDVFFRDAWRRQNMGYEHSLMLDTTLLPDFLSKYGYRTAHEDGYEYAMSFADDAAPKGENAVTVTANFSTGSGKTTTFEYDAASGKYLVSEYGKAMTDVIDDSQLAVKNVFVLSAEMSQIANDSKGRMSCGLIGTGSGYFACGGKYTKIVWSKNSATSQFAFSLEDGTNLTLGRGNSYVCVVPSGSGSADFS